MQPDEGLKQSATLARPSGPLSSTEPAMSMVALAPDSAERGAGEVGVSITVAPCARTKPKSPRRFRWFAFRRFFGRFRGLPLLGCPVHRNFPVKLDLQRSPYLGPGQTQDPGTPETRVYPGPAAPRPQAYPRPGYTPEPGYTRVRLTRIYSVLRTTTNCPKRSTNARNCFPLSKQ